MEKAMAEDSSGYRVRLDIFEGPLDLLLFLIKQQEIDIYDIPIATITKQYLDYVEMMQLLDLEVAGEYLVMAATLLHIKSRMLLPQEVEDEELELEDPRQELVRKLLEYQQFKEVAASLSEREESQREVFWRSLPAEEEGEETVEPVQRITLFQLLEAFRQALQRSPEPSLYAIERATLSVEARIEEILDQLSREDKVLFWDLLGPGPTRAFVVVTFVALLEMMRRRRIVVRQTHLFGDIWICRTE